MFLAKKSQPHSKSSPYSALAMVAFLLLLLLLPRDAAAQDLRVVGFVNDENTSAVARALVTLEVTDMRIRRQIASEQTRTGFDGSYEFDIEKFSEVPELGLQVNAISPVHREALAIKVLKRDELPVRIDLILPAGAAAKGQVLNLKGDPVVGAAVSASGTRVVKTDAQGRFELFGLDPNYRNTLLVKKENHVDHYGELDPNAAETWGDLKIVLREALFLRGRILRPDGSPMSRGVVALHQGRRYLDARPDDQGRFEFPSAPSMLEDFDISFAEKELSYARRPLTEQEQQLREVEIRLLWPLRMEGVVRHPGGSPADGGVVIVTPAEGRPMRQQIATDGSWSSPPLPPGGQYTITAYPEDLATQRIAGELEFIETEDGALTAFVDPWPKGFRSDYEVTIEGAEITMTRTDKGPGAIPGVLVYTGTLEDGLGRMKGTIAGLEAGVTGEFTARAYNPGSSVAGVWDIRETIKREQAPAPALKLVAGAPFPCVQSVDLQFSPAGRLAGRLRTPDGELIPSGEAVLTTWNGIAELNQRVAIEGGLFAFDRVPEGYFELMAIDGAGAMYGPLFVESTEAEVDLKLDQAAEDEVDGLGK